MCKTQKSKRQKGMIIINYEEIKEKYVSLVLDIELLSSQYGLTYKKVIRQAKNKQQPKLIYINNKSWSELSKNFELFESDAKEYAKNYGIGINILKKRLAKTDIDSIGTTLTSAIGQAIQETA